MRTQRSLESQEEPRQVAFTMEHLTIGQLAYLTGITAKNIRYYEQVGLLPCPQRTMNGYRRYTQVDVNRVVLLRRLRLLSIPLTDLRALLTDASHARCHEVLQDLLPLVARKRVALDQEIADLQRLRMQVEQYQHQLANCHPDEQESFRVCRDMSCLALIDEA